MTVETGETGWEVDPDDEWGVAVITTVGRQLKLRREAAGMRAGGFGVAVGYGEDLVYKVEGGKRIPRQEYLDRADEVLGAGGLLSAAWEDVKKVRCPKKVRALGKLEAQAVEIAVYQCNSVNGLLQTPDHARAVIGAAHTLPTMWSAWWRPVWLGSRSSNAHPRPPSVSFWKRGFCVGPSGAQWPGGSSSNVCWRWGSCTTSCFR